ncbi:type II secretion system protein [Candidatus Giovannonibacteria bacterium]|nr:type II secretion system protein [Candidatus Giovannonibacteria bacterium]
MHFVVKQVSSGFSRSSKKSGFGFEKKGFTLIELLVVIAIIGILASVVLANYNEGRKSARDARRVSDLRQVQLALENYFLNMRNYPAGNTWSSLTSPLSTYLPVVPVDPLNSGSNVYNYKSLTAAGADCSSACTSYVLRAVTERDAANNPVFSNDVDGSWGGYDCEDNIKAYCLRP